MEKQGAAGSELETTEAKRRDGARALAEGRRRSGEWVIGRKGSGQKTQRAERRAQGVTGEGVRRYAPCAWRQRPLGNRGIRREVKSLTGLPYLDSHRLRACRR